MEHVDIPDGERHEPKGAGSASANQVLRSTGSGNTTFSFLTKASFPSVVSRGFELVLNGASTALLQEPSAVDTPHQIEFGAAQTTASASLSAAGVTTINQAGTYAVSVFFRFGRTSSAGNAILLNRVLVNGAQVLNTNSISIPDSAATTPFSATLMFDFEVGDTISFQIARDGAGANNGGLVRTPISTLPWNIASTASIAIYKHRGLE